MSESYCGAGYLGGRNATVAEDIAHLPHTFRMLSSMSNIRWLIMEDLYLRNERVESQV